MAATSSIEAAAPLWREVIELVLRTDDGVPEPVANDRLVAREVCRLTGRRPTGESPGTVREWFLAGTEPTEDASIWLRRDASGQVQLTLPAEYAAWCRSSHNFLGAHAEPPATLAIRSPAAGGIYTLDRDLPPAQQMLNLEAEGPDAAAFHWTVDEQPIANRAGLCLWPLTAGNHTARLSAGALRAEVQFAVRP
jgi:membrane carboxypeptidase/penicillin-binding protein PbpC